MSSRIITVKTIYGDKQVKAMLIGQWAVHRAIGSDKYWTITLIANGMAAIHYAPTRRAAVDLAQRFEATGVDFNRNGINDDPELRDIVSPIYRVWAREWAIMSNI